MSEDPSVYHVTPVNDLREHEGLDKAAFLAGMLHRDYGVKIASDIVFQCLRGISGRSKDPETAINEAIKYYKKRGDTRD